MYTSIPGHALGQQGILMHPLHIWVAVQQVNHELSDLAAARLAQSGCQWMLGFHSLHVNSSSVWILALGLSCYSANIVEHGDLLISVPYAPTLHRWNEETVNCKLGGPQHAHGAQRHHGILALSLTRLSRVDIAEMLQNTYARFSKVVFHWSYYNTLAC